ncbi:type IX secretion system membrane protein PorP/SprF [Pedobacter sp. SD-b]|uniref:Type IX secretion system membrane protein PorP/SprF n=1 Tax=Pedobacter segetis TaxID=2793069 RepID=A0ABS1BL78_9SPHI|nr:type IX secretion system membrane protein PorP/SprF [Pedobacter segetis]MBK0383496.1 type IX secretion system membrane protein PorP/SprF [Pedobacter segetis]
MKISYRIFIVLSFLSSICYAQQRPHYTQYLQNMDIINPAVTGMFKAVTVKAGFRNQWVGIADAPKTSYITIHTPLNIDGSILTAGSADYGVDEPFTRSEKDAYESSENHHGIGFTALNDKTGPINRTTLNLTYAYHIMLGDIANLSFGVGGGVSRIGLNTDVLQFEDPNDPVVTQGQIINWSPDLNVGFYFYGSQFYFGGSIQQVVKEKLSFADNFDKGAQIPHYFLTAGYTIWASEDIAITSSVMLKYVNPTPKAFDFNLKVAFRNNFWLGGSYRTKDAYAVLAGFTISKTMNAGYSFDKTISTLQNINSGTHEFVLGFKF